MALTGLQRELLMLFASLSVADQDLVLGWLRQLQPVPRAASGPRAAPRAVPPTPAIAADPPPLKTQSSATKRRPLAWGDVPRLSAPMKTRQR